MRIEKVQRSVRAATLLGWQRVVADDGSTVAYAPDMPTAQLVLLAAGATECRGCALLERIHALMNGTEWDSDTLADIAEELRRGGYQIEEVKNSARRDGIPPGLGE